jgi:GntR family transcriptional regulator
LGEKTDEISYKSPIYLQLREVIRNKIDEGEFQAGTSIPSENELAAMYSVNRLTVRNAMSKLVNEGILKRVKGKGAYVVPDRVERDLEQLGGFVQVTREKKRTLQNKILVKTERKAGNKYALIFGIKPDEKIFYIRRISYADDEPVSLDESYIPKYLVPNLENIDLSVFSLYQVYKLNGINVVRANQTLDLTTLEPSDARTMGIISNVAVMLFECISFDEKERVVEFTRTFTRGDKCDFNVKFHE